MSSQHRIFMAEGNQGGIPAGTFEAKAAIARVGLAQNGERWNPGHHMVAKLPANERRIPECIDCRRLCVNPNALRCRDCSDKRQRRPTRAPYGVMRGGG